MLPGTLTMVDAIAILFIAIGAIQGLFRRLSGEMARLLGAICAFVAGALLHEPLGGWIATYTRLVDQEARILTYVVTVLTALILWTLFHKLIKKCLQLILAPAFDKVAGIPAGTLRMTALVGIVFIAMNLWPDMPFQETFGNDSFFGRHAIRLVPAVQRELDARNIPMREPRNTGQTAPTQQQHQEETTP